MVQSEDEVVITCECPAYVSLPDCAKIGVE